MTSPGSTPSASRLASYLGSLGVQAPQDRLSLETVAYAALLDVVSAVAPEVTASIEAELADQRSHLKLIASENYASPAVLLAMGNWLSDKYAEGSPFHRFYAGCENVDAIESRGDELAKALFGSDHAYLQPHSGIDANLVAFWTILTDRVEGPALERLGRKDLLSLSEEEWAGLRRDSSPSAAASRPSPAAGSPPAGSSSPRGGSVWTCAWSARWAPRSSVTGSSRRWAIPAGSSTTPRRTGERSTSTCSTSAPSVTTHWSTC